MPTLNTLLNVKEESINEVEHFQKFMNTLRYSYGTKKYGADTSTDDGFYMGMEIEVKTEDSKSELPRHESSTRLMGGLRVGLWGASTDGVPGIEVKTAPMTLDYIHKSRVISDFYNHAEKYVNNINEGNQLQCGIHVHIDSKNITGLMTYKMGKLVYENKEFTEAVAGRECFSNKYCNKVPLYDRYSMNPPFKKSLEYLEDYKDGNNCRYYSNKFAAMNVGKGSTIEFRIFKSDITPSFIKACFEYVHSVTVFAKEAEVKDISVDNYIVFLNKNYRVYPNIKRRVSEVWKKS